MQRGLGDRKAVCPSVKRVNCNKTKAPSDKKAKFYEGVDYELSSGPKIRTILSTNIDHFFANHKDYRANDQCFSD